MPVRPLVRPAARPLARPGFGRVVSGGGSAPQGIIGDAAALFARFTTPPSAARAGLINNLILALVQSDVWPKLDALYIMAAADSQAAKLNWIANQYNLTEVNAPTFTADRGFAGDGATSYLDSVTYIPTGTGQYTLNSAHLSVWCNVDPAGANVSEIFLSGANVGSVGVRRASGNANAFMNDQDNLNSFVASGVGFTIGNRTGAAVKTVRKNNAALTNNTAAAVSLPTGAMTVLTAGSARRLATASAGAGLTVSQSDALYAALNSYLTAVGGA